MKAVGHPIPAKSALLSTSKYCPAGPVPPGVRRRKKCRWWGDGGGDVESAAGAGLRRMAGSGFRPLSTEGPVGRRRLGGKRRFKYKFLSDFSAGKGIPPARITKT
jgi:hypothetical protein